MSPLRSPRRPFDLCTLHFHTTDGGKWEKAIGSDVPGLKIIRYIPLTIEEKCEQLNNVYEAGLLAGLGAAEKKETP